MQATSDYNKWKARGYKNQDEGAHHKMMGLEPHFPRYY
jgi:hypothetical protein